MGSGSYDGGSCPCGFRSILPLWVDRSIDFVVVFSRSLLFCSVPVTFGQGSFIDRSDPVSDIAVGRLYCCVFKKPFILQRAGDIRPGVLYRPLRPCFRYCCFLKKVAVVLLKPSSFGVQYLQHMVSADTADPESDFSLITAPSAGF